MSRISRLNYQERHSIAWQWRVLNARYVSAQRGTRRGGRCEGRLKHIWKQIKRVEALARRGT